MRRFSLQKIAPTALCAMLLALAAALGTHFALKTLYGVPAPAAPAPLAVAAAASVPAWLAGGSGAQASDMSLLGVVAQSADGKRGLALLQTSSSERAKVYAVGQTLGNGAVLQSVQARSVVLDVQGQLQTVQLDAKGAAAGVAINPVRGVSVVESLAAPAVPNPMSAALSPSQAAAVSNANAARLAAKRQRSLSAVGQPVDAQGEPPQQP